MRSITGRYSMAGRSNMRPATALLWEDGSLRILATDYDYELISTHIDECRQGDILPGIPVELHFPDGDYFIPDEADLRWKPRSGVLAYMESHILMVLLAALLVPTSFWLVFTQAIPAAARTTAPLIPHEIMDRVGQSSLKSLEYSMQPSGLPQYRQAEILKRWNATAEEAGLTRDYQIIFRDGGQPNAFALPDGTIVVFDELVELLDDDQLTAVLFHEVGHVDLYHGAQMMVQASAGALVYGLLLGDMEGLSESILGLGISLGQNAFSRDMETAADDFAVLKLKAVGIPPDVMASALEALPGGERGSNSWREYLSSHPEKNKRIDRIQNTE